MADWFGQAPIGDNLVRISEPRVHPLLSANLWWLRGTDRDIVVDAGLGVVALREEIPALFERDPLLVLTHSHLDHAGGAHEFRERAAHPAEAATLAAGPPGSLYGAELYAKLGIPDDGEPVPDLLIRELPHPGYDPRGYRVEPAPLTRVLADQERIDLGGRVLTVMHLPGHTPGSMALFEERTGVLFSGDVIYDDDPIDSLPDSSIPDYRRTMERLARLSVSVVHPGHGHSFDEARLHALATRYLDRVHPIS
ncbi:MBL fold metallo-hydrolase [Asanoa sp. NPDC049573]|uniref:MBL fold metallo-hydrolase n=1 Tax=Asanoa sp. NPDC049573 TaxID=3155396 RepID=UPI0034319E52